MIRRALATLTLCRGAILVHAGLRRLPADERARCAVALADALLTEYAPQAKRTTCTEVALDGPAGEGEIVSVGSDYLKVTR